MKPAWKWAMAAGAVMLVAGPFLTIEGPAIGESLISVHVPSSQNDNLLFALPLFLIGILIKFGAVLVIYIAGILIGLTGLIILIVGLVQWLRSRRKTATSTPLKTTP
ncbi:MAG: hypothetical protein ACOYM3_22060 [Terrimicrobiaceae bacterium]